MREFTLIHGCMFAGKTTKLIDLYNESPFLSEEKLAVKPLLDQRYNASRINSHGGLQMLAHRISKAEEIYPLLSETTQEVYIDEVQFMGPYVIEVIGEIMMNNIHVIAAGLDKDYMARDFGPMAALKKLATQRIEVKAQCHICQKPANFTYREPGTNDLLVVGHSDIYQARCEEHWVQGMEGRLEISSPA
jgi:thymidine kinase